MMRLTALVSPKSRPPQIQATRSNLKMPTRPQLRPPTMISRRASPSSARMGFPLSRTVTGPTSLPPGRGRNTFSEQVFLKHDRDVEQAVAGVVEEHADGVRTVV